MTKAVPDGFHSITPSFTFKNSQKAIDFYKDAFDAKVVDLLPNLDGKGVMHAAIQIGNSILMMGDEMPNPDCSKSAETMKGSPISLYIYTPDVDAMFKKAVSAGAVVTMPLGETFWGDRAAGVKDPFGYSWMIATHTKDLTHQQINEGAKAFFAGMSKA